MSPTLSRPYTIKALTTATAYRQPKRQPTYSLSEPLFSYCNHPSPSHSQQALLDHKLVLWRFLCSVPLDEIMLHEDHDGGEGCTTGCS